MSFSVQHLPFLCAGGAVYLIYPPIKKATKAGILALRCLFEGNSTLSEKKAQAFEEFKSEIKSNGLKNFSIFTILIASSIIIYRNNQINEQKISQINSDKAKEVEKIANDILNSVNFRINESNFDKLQKISQSEFNNELDNKIFWGKVNFAFQAFLSTVSIGVQWTLPGILYYLPGRT